MLRARGPGPLLPVDAGDDAAVLPGGRVVTIDSLVEGVHFHGDADPESLGHKVLAVSVSDILAMGALPDTAFLALSLPQVHLEWVDAFARGLATACAAYGVHLAGGDTTGSPGPRFLSLTLLGQLPRGRAPWTRSGARPGDRLLVTGNLGTAGGAWMRSQPSSEAVAALTRPSPPFGFVRDMPHGLVHAAMDLSDGLAVDLPRLCAASGCGARVQPERLPATPTVAADPERLMLQTRGGEDYQLLLAVPPEAKPALEALAASTDTRLTDVGQMVAEPGAELIGAAWPTPRFAHFGDGS